MEHIEVELKFPLLNGKELAEKLNSIAKPGKQNDFQKDAYYTPAHRNFLAKKPVAEWLRLRESKKGFSLTYKKWHKDKDTKAVSCDEFETKIESVDALKRLFASLDFKELVVVDKIRNTWSHKGTEIAIDEVSGLGSFIEIEAKSDFAGIEEAKNHLFTVLKEIGAKVGEQDFVGYAYLLAQKKGLV